MPLKIVPGSEDNRFCRAMRHKQSGEYDEAEALFKAIIIDQPANADAHWQLGLTYSYRMFIDESIAALDHAVALVPNSRIYLTDLAKTLAMYGDFDRLKPIFDRLLELEG